MRALERGEQSMVGRRHVRCIALLVAGCGGKAFVDGGSGGASGTGNEMTTNVTTGLGSLCERACTAIQSCLAISDCVSHCEQSPETCMLQQDAFLSCIAEHTTPGRCDMPPDCIDELANYQSCRGLVLPSGYCVNYSGDCTCEMTDAQHNTYEFGCEPEGRGSQCRCGFEGQTIGSCSSPNIPACDPLNDCCATLFNVPGYP